jgi:hypothetical protein
LHYQESTYPPNWLGDQEVDTLMQMFFAADYFTSAKLAKNPYTYEDSLTDHLISTLTEQYVRKKINKYPGVGGNKTVFRFTPRPKEPKTGADIGIIVRTRNEDIDIIRALLIQCKKMHFNDPLAAMENFTQGGKPEYAKGLFEGRAKDQAKKMTDITPASFFMVYNAPLMTWVPIGVEDIKQNLEFLDSIARNLNTIDIYRENSECIPYLNNYHGLTVFPASTIKGCFQADHSKMRKSKNQLEGIRRAFRYGIPFHEFMVNDVLQGKIGDTREEIIKVAAGQNPEVFDPRYILILEIFDHS